MTSLMGKSTGFQMDMSKLQSIQIQPDGKTAWFQGGTYGQQVWSICGIRATSQVRFLPTTAFQHPIPILSGFLCYHHLYCS